jgi:hypothetical protein
LSQIPSDGGTLFSLNTNARVSFVLLEEDGIVVFIPLVEDPLNFSTLNAPPDISCNCEFAGCTTGKLIWLFATDVVPVDPSEPVFVVEP